MKTAGENPVERVFTELKMCGLIEKNRKLKEKKVKTAKASVFGKTIYCDPICKSLDEDCIRTVLLHEEGHQRLKQNTRWIFMYIRFMLIVMLSVLVWRPAFLILVSPLLVLFLLLPFLIPASRSKLMQDENDADLWAAERLFMFYGDKEPWETLWKSLNRLRKLSERPKSRIRTKISEKFDIHPSIDERRDYVKKMLEIAKRQEARP